MAFTAGSLYLQESVELAQLYQISRDWKSVRSGALEKNVIRARTVSSATRVCREICLRLEGLQDAELKVLAEGTIQEQQQILWVAICRRHLFIRDFSVEIMREKFFQLNLDLYPKDYDAFFNAKAEWHDELERLTESTRNKLRQVLFRMLREADLLTKSNTIHQVMLSPRVARTVGSYLPDDLRNFLLSDRDIRELLQ